MRSIKLLFVMFVLAATLGQDVLAAQKEPAAVKPFYVKVRESKLRQSGSYFAPITASVRYGEELTPVSAGDAQWIQVKTGKGVKGYVHISSLSDKKILLASATKSFFDTGYDSSEVVLAGKGFNSEVEKAYAASNSGLRFDAVDAAEKLKVTQAELRAFLKEGGLSQPRG